MLRSRNSFLWTLPSNDNVDGKPGKFTTYLDHPIDFGPDPWVVGLWAISYPRSWYNLSSSRVQVYHADKHIAEIRLAAGNYTSVEDILVGINDGLATIGRKVDADIKRNVEELHREAIRELANPLTKASQASQPTDQVVAGRKRRAVSPPLLPIPRLGDFWEVRRQRVVTARRILLEDILRDTDEDVGAGSRPHSYYHRLLALKKGFSEDDMREMYELVAPKNHGPLTSFLMKTPKRETSWKRDLESELSSVARFTRSLEPGDEVDGAGGQQGVAFTESDLASLPHFGNGCQFEWDATTSRVELQCGPRLSDYSFKLDNRSLALSLGFRAEERYPFSGTRGKVVSRRPLDNPSSVFVYADVVQPQRVGSVERRLLEIVPIIGESDEVPKFSPVNVNYLPVNGSVLNRIHIEITNQWGDAIEFLSGTTVVQLHFRRAASLV